MESFLVVAAVIINQSQDATKLRSVADRLHSSVIEVKATREDEEASWGTGVLLGNGLALTALHSVGTVAADGQVTPLGTIDAVVYDHGEVRAHVVAAAPELDLALLRLESGNSIAAAPLAGEAPSVGDHLVAMGARNEEIVAAGVTVSVSEDDGSLVFTSPRKVDSRFWGGPVFDGQGQLTAMTLHSRGSIRAVSIASLRSLIDQASSVQ
ncbi:MAG TPA: serine protease [Myxococcales bacterium]|nr:serine protease [Myxococcales bacterium]